MLLDECVDQPSAKRILRGHNAMHVGPAGFAGTKDGPLLIAAAQAGFELLFTTDQRLRHQQNTRMLPLRVLVIEARNTRASGLERLAPAIRNALTPAELLWRLAVIDNVGRFHVLVGEPPAASP